MTKKAKKITGLILILLPPVGLITSIVGYAITAAVFSGAIRDGAADSGAVVANVISVVLSLLGFLSIIGFFVLIPIGIVFLVLSIKSAEQKNMAAAPQPDQEPGMAKVTAKAKETAEEK